MRLDTISNTNWRTFIARYPDAYSLLLDASLKGELLELQSNEHLNAWQIERLSELEILKEYYGQGE